MTGNTAHGQQGGNQVHNTADIPEGQYQTLTSKIVNTNSAPSDKTNISNKSGPMEVEMSVMAEASTPVVNMTDASVEAQ